MSLLNLPNELLHEILMQASSDPVGFLHFSGINRRLHAFISDPYTRSYYAKHWFAANCNDITAPRAITLVPRFFRLHIHSNMFACSPYWESRYNNLHRTGTAAYLRKFLIDSATIGGFARNDKFELLCWIESYIQHIKSMPRAAIDGMEGHTIKTLPFMLEDAVLVWYIHRRLLQEAQKLHNEYSHYYFFCSSLEVMQNLHTWSTRNFHVWYEKRDQWRCACVWNSGKMMEMEWRLYLEN